MRAALDQLQQEGERAVAVAESTEALDRVALDFFGRKQGRLTALLRTIGTLGSEARRSAGQRANEVKEELERLIDARRASLEQHRFARLEASEWIDVTAPGRRLPLGHVHPISSAIQAITALFERIGFMRVRHPEVDSDYYAFEALNMPAGHPARDEWETFFVASSTEKTQHPGRIVLTPHTSNGQVREMEKGRLPIRMVNIGRCYRRQIDATHTPTFHQFEGLLIDHGVTVANLKGTIDYFVRSYFGPERRVRLRPFHFRFTEPSFEVDVSCVVCGGTGRRNDPDGMGGVREQCRTCKAGWMELAGAGMVHPNVLRAGGVDPTRFSGFAFGFGVERVLMMKQGIDDIRLLYGNDLRFLAQF